MGWGEGMGVGFQMQQREQRAVAEPRATAGTDRARSRDKSSGIDSAAHLNIGPISIEHNAMPVTTVNHEILAVDGGTPVRKTLLPYGRQSVGEDDIQAVVDVLRSDWLTTGPKGGEFEEAFAA